MARIGKKGREKEGRGREEEKEGASRVGKLSRRRAMRSRGRHADGKKRCSREIGVGILPGEECGWRTDVDGRPGVLGTGKQQQQQRRRENFLLPQRAEGP